MVLKLYTQDEPPQSQLKIDTSLEQINMHGFIRPCKGHTFYIFWWVVNGAG